MDKNFNASRYARQLVYIAKEKNRNDNLEEKGFDDVEDYLRSPYLDKMLIYKISILGDEEKEAVLEEIELISKEAQEGILKNGSYDCEAGRTEKACNTIKSFESMIESGDIKPIFEEPNIENYTFELYPEDIDVYKNLNNDMDPFME